MTKGPPPPLPIELHPLNGGPDADLIGSQWIMTYPRPSCKQAKHLNWSRPAVPAGKLKTRHSTPSRIKGIILNTILVTAKSIYRTTFLCSTCWPFPFTRSLSYAIEGYQYCRSKFSSRKEYWNNLRGAIRLMLFRDFDHLLRNVADPPEIRAP